uniref:Uncharacterized protein n=1 Tax=Rhizophora mucronata TaxID=61149 RepID=A0A2P2NH80_RHIMU
MNQQYHIIQTAITWNSRKTRMAQKNFTKDLVKINTYSNK